MKYNYAKIMLCFLMLAFLSACGGDPDIKSGDGWVKVGDFYKAETSYYQAVQTDPASLKPRIRLVDLYLSDLGNGRVASAIEQLDEIGDLKGGVGAAKKYAPEIRIAISQQLNEGRIDALPYALKYAHKDFVDPLGRFIVKIHSKSYLDKRKFKLWYNALTASIGSASKAEKFALRQSINDPKGSLNYFTSLLIMAPTDKVRQKITSLYSEAFEKDWKTFDKNGAINLLLEFNNSKASDLAAKITVEGLDKNSKAYASAAQRQSKHPIVKAAIISDFEKITSVMPQLINHEALSRNGEVWRQVNQRAKKALCASSARNTLVLVANTKAVSEDKLREYVEDLLIWQGGAYNKTCNLQTAIWAIGKVSNNPQWGRLDTHTGGGHSELGEVFSRYFYAIDRARYVSGIPVNDKEIFASIRKQRPNVRAQLEAHGYELVPDKRYVFSTVNVISQFYIADIDWTAPKEITVTAYSKKFGEKHKFIFPLKHIQEKEAPNAEDSYGEWVLTKVSVFI